MRAARGQPHLLRVEAEGCCSSNWVRLAVTTPNTGLVVRGGGAEALSVHSLAMRVERFMRARDLQTDSPLLALWRAKPETNGAPVVCLELAPALWCAGAALGLWACID